MCFRDLEDATNEALRLFGAILRVQNILTSFDQFADDALLTPRQEQDYRSIYLDLYAEFRTEQDNDKEPINEDIDFEMELIKQVEINVDYILMLVEKYRESHKQKKRVFKRLRAFFDRFHGLATNPDAYGKHDLGMFNSEIHVDNMKPRAGHNQHGAQGHKKP